MKFKILPIIFFGLFIYQAKAEIILPRILGNGMVLQQKKPIVIWGTAAANEKVNVSFAGKKAFTITDINGNWKVILPSLKASNTGKEMIIKGSNTIILKDILVGEVWLCSGQSNMEYTMRKNSKVDKQLGANLNPNPVDELAIANHKNIRLFLVNRKELIKPDSAHKGWNNAEGNALRAFSAAAYFFAKKLNQDLNVPIGMISSSIPGSRIEPWISEDAFLTSSYFRGKKIDGDPAKFYHPMIAPLIPFAIKGFLWYQGETNCFLKERESYTKKMETLIKGWRKDWGDQKMPFYFVQIAPFLYSSSKGEVKYTSSDLPEFWEAQAAATQIKHTGMITITDLVANVNDIHPAYKWEVGRRLALMALQNTYKQTIEGSGPVFDKMNIRKNQIIISFNHAKGLKSKDGEPLSYFEIAGADGKFVNAFTEIVGKTIVLHATQVSKPVFARFAWSEAAQPNLFNAENLPARPFRTNSNSLFNPLKP